MIQAAISAMRLMEAPEDCRVTAATWERKYNEMATALLQDKNVAAGEIALLHKRLDEMSTQSHGWRWLYEQVVYGPPNHIQGKNRRA